MNQQKMAGSSTAAGNGSTTLSRLGPAAGTDDGRWDDTAQYFNNGSAGRVGLSTTHWNTWTRYVLNIPQGATINSATLCWVQEVARSSKNYNINFYAVKEVDAAAPTSAADADGRTLTTAVANYTATGVTYVIGDEFTSPDLSAVIQEVVNQASWAANNHIVIYLKDNGSTSDMQPALFEHTSDSIELTVNYTS